jgi:hypothetical protein
LLCLFACAESRLFQAGNLFFQDFDFGFSIGLLGPLDGYHGFGSAAYKTLAGEGFKYSFYFNYLRDEFA